MAAPKIGASIKVDVYTTEKEYRDRANARQLPASVISDGPKTAIGAAWARVPASAAPPAGRWLLVRQVPGSMPARWYARLDDPDGH